MLYYTEAFTTNVTFVWLLTCVVRVGVTTVATLVVPLTTVFIYLRMRFHISVATNGRLSHPVFFGQFPAVYQ